MKPPDTASLSFRPLSLDDAEAMAAIICDANVMEFSDNGPYLREAVPGWIEKQVDPATYRGPPFGRWAVMETATGTVIGYGTLSRHDGRTGPNEAEIGYRLARAHWGKGYGTEVAKALIDYGLALPAIERLIAIVSPHNKASVRVLEKAGMSMSGEIMLPGYDYPDLVYAITA